MPDISRIILPSGTEYRIKDEVARSISGGGIRFRGITTTVIGDGSTATHYQIEGETIEVANGDLVIYNHKEFIYSEFDSCWHELGDNSALGPLAYKENATTYYTPRGSISAQEFSGTSGNVSVTGTPTGSITVNVGDGQTNFTPEGTISRPNVNVTLNTSTGFIADSATGGGLVAPGIAAECSLPELTMTVTDEVLRISWDAGAFTANTPTTVQLPTFTQATIASGVQSAGLDATPQFTGTPVDLEAAFVGDNLVSTGSFTPEGTVSRPTFNGTTDEIVVS